MRIEERSGALVVVDFDDLEACKIAVRIERDGMAFYEALAGRMTAAAARGSILSLASQERDHLEFFEGELARLRATKEDAFEEDDLASSLEYGIFAPYRDLAVALESPRKALRLGQIVEERSVQFYEACRGRVASDETKRQLDRIIAEERLHARRLKEMQDALPKA
ncbi:MAG: ferritin family protein [Chlamydiota bacterium]